VGNGVTGSPVAFEALRCTSESCFPSNACLVTVVARILGTDVAGVRFSEQARMALEYRGCGFESRQGAGDPGKPGRHPVSSTAELRESRSGEEQP